MPDYLEGLIKENTRQSLDEAEPLAAGKPEILQRISEARKTLEQPKKLIGDGSKIFFRFQETAAAYSQR